MSKKYTFHVHGMHCNSCVLLTESKLKEHEKVFAATSNLNNRIVEIEGDFGDTPHDIVAAELTALVSPHGYTLSLEREAKKINWKEFSIAAPIALGFMTLFLLLQKLGIVNLVSTGNVTYGTAFVVGVIASLSTCMAVVGGLVLSVSASFAKEGDNVKPQLLFHAGRIVSFFVLGGVIGALGSVFQLGSLGTLVLNIIVGAVMLLLGLNLLDIFHITKKLQPSMPKFISRHMLGLTKLNHSLTPLLIGAVTFFLPCGFTQSMQLYTLTTGNFLQGALTMFTFALGTLPVLALISFSALGIHKKTTSSLFFKTAGLVVIFFVLFNLLNSFAAQGWIPPLFNF